MTDIVPKDEPVVVVIGAMAHGKVNIVRNITQVKLQCFKCFINGQLGGRLQFTGALYI